MLAGMCLHICVHFCAGIAVLNVVLLVLLVARGGQELAAMFESGRISEEVGSTAVVAVVTPQRLVVANAGGSQTLNP